CCSTGLRGLVHVLMTLRVVQITFDPRCNIGSDSLTRLAFYRDEYFQVIFLSVVFCETSIRSGADFFVVSVACVLSGPHHHVSGTVPSRQFALRPPILGLFS